MTETPQQLESTSKPEACEVHHIDSSDEQAARLANEEDHNETILEAIKRNPQSFLWCIYASWCLILASFESLAGGSVIGIPQFRVDFGHKYNGEYILDGKWQSAIDGGPRAGIAVGTLIAAYLSDRIGRKYMLMVGYLVSYAGITLEIVATKMEVFFAGKFLCGLAIGCYSSVSVCYVGEVAPLALRGVMTAFCAFGFVFGPFVGALIQNYTSTGTTRWAYRAMFASQYGFLVVATVFWPWMPESPWWLLCRDDEKRATRSLKRLGFAASDEAHKRLAAMKVTLAQVREETQGVTYLECFKRNNLRRTLISIAPISMQACTGITFIGSYFTFYIQLAGYSAGQSFQLQIVQQTVSMVGNIVSWFLIDRVGRRTLTLWGLVGVLVILCITGGLATRAEVPSIRGVIALELIFVWYYNLSIGATAYAFLAEVSTSRLRAKSVAIGVFVQNSLYTMLAFVLPYLFNPDKANLQAKTAFIFGGLTLLSTIWIYFNQPETAGRTYEELDEMFIKKIPARKFKSYRTDMEQREQE